MLNQEQVLHKITDVAKLTGEFVLKVLYFMVADGADAIKSSILPKKFVGEVAYQKLMATNSTKLAETFKASELHVDSLKDYLKQYGVAFSVVAQDDGQKTLIFEAKNKALVEEAFKQTVAKLTDESQGKELLDDLKMTPEKLPFEEKVKYFEAQEQADLLAEKLAKGTELNHIQEKSL